MLLAIVPLRAILRPEPSTLLPPLAVAELSAVATMVAFSVAVMEIASDVAVTGALVTVADAPPTTSFNTDIAVAAIAPVGLMLKSVGWREVTGNSFQRLRLV